MLLCRSWLATVTEPVGWDGWFISGHKIRWLPACGVTHCYHVCCTLKLYSSPAAYSALAALQVAAATTHPRWYCRQVRCQAQKTLRLRCAVEPRTEIIGFEQELASSFFV